MKWQNTAPCRQAPGPARRPWPGGGVRPAEGFSLLEVLVATTLMGLVLVAMLQLLTGTLRAQAGAWGNTRALLVADKVLQENCQISSLAGGTYQGKDGPYSYRVRITPQYQVEMPFSFQVMLCSLVEVTVTWQEWGQSKSITLRTARTAIQKKS